MDKAMELLEQLAAKLGTTSEYLWRVLVAGQWYEGLIDAMFIGAVFVAACIGIGVIYRRIKKMDEGDRTGGVILLVIFGSLALFGILSGLSLALLRMLAPEYAALRYILNTITQ